MLDIPIPSITSRHAPVHNSDRGGKMETSINPTQRNPRCPWAARLADVIQNDEAIRIDLRTGDVMYIPFFRGWREKSETLVVASVYDRDIDLVEAGAHPSIVDGEWDRDHILVLVDQIGRAHV